MKLSVFKLNKKNLIKSKKKPVECHGTINIFKEKTDHFYLVSFVCPYIFPSFCIRDIPYNKKNVILMLFRFFDNYN